MSDRLALAHVIEDAGIPREKAEAVATAIARFVEGSAATKADVERVEVTVRAVEVALRAEIARIADRTFNRLGALVVVVIGILFAALHMWPPH
jgi:hypothetical protein